MVKQKKKSRLEKLQTLPAAAREVVEAKLVELEEVAREERNTILAGAALFVAGVIVGALVTKRRGD